MQARTWILAGVLAGTAVARRHASRADDASPEVVAPRREVAPTPPPTPLAFRPVPATPKVAAEVGALGAALAEVIEDGPSFEQTGDPRAAVTGNVRDVASGEEVAGVVVIATSPALEHTQTAITDEDGTYKLVDLPPGEYLMTFYYADITLERPGLVLDAGSLLSVPVVLDPDEHPRPPISITMDGSDVVNIPVPGRTFESVLGAAAGSQVDGTGVSFTGVTSLENTYIVDE